MDERLIKIADHYGLDSQLDMLQEECAELIQAVSKYKRCRKVASLDACVPILTEEMADVYIMLDQIKYLVNNQNSVHDWMETKIDRQLERMDGDDHV